MLTFMLNDRNPFGNAQQPANGSVFGGNAAGQGFSFGGTSYI